ncbi:ABC transporter permease subunit [Candidatus Poribacteria bacterium]|jgi:peptide/nickel transport system permease protein|nr:ABC transporter permease subunit [Candidatus Poribacteria bacterium]MBT5531820.1 ABC transporter permease subunit [Candidatus Poribacteria bacterium]MBT5711746.1 ABC transporter permease subunit [Candidatus Poribacteria bacterium]MBT7807969.1 ABC transporter permease subunit [Candidatus Poribacteria bacterium]
MYALIRNIVRNMFILLGVTYLVYGVGLRATTVPFAPLVYGELDKADPTLRLRRLRELAQAYTQADGDLDDAALYDLGVATALALNDDPGQATTIRRYFQPDLDISSYIQGAKIIMDTAPVAEAPSSTDVFDRIRRPEAFPDIDFYRAVASYGGAGSRDRSRDSRTERASAYFRGHARAHPRSVSGRLALANHASLRASLRQDLPEIQRTLAAAIPVLDSEALTALLMLAAAQVHIARREFADGVRVARMASSTDNPRIAHEARLLVGMVEDRALEAGYMQRMLQIVRLDLAPTKTMQEVWPRLRLYLRNTLTLAALATILALAIAVPAGICLAAAPASLVTQGARWALYLVSGAPVFLLGLIGLRYFPPVAGSVAHHALAAACLAFGNSLVSQITQRVEREASVLLRADFVMAVRARQAPVWRHLMRNLARPVLATYVAYVPALLSGAIVVEEVLGRLGVGFWLLQAAKENDFAVLLPCCVSLVLLVVAANTARDMLLVIVDPRVRT